MVASSRHTPGPLHPMAPVHDEAISVRPLGLDEIDLRIEYFHSATDDFLRHLGVDRARLPAPQEWRAWYRDDYARPIEERQSYAVGWELDGEVVGLSSVDPFSFGRRVPAPPHPRSAQPAGRPGRRVRPTLGPSLHRRPPPPVPVQRAQRLQPGPEPDPPTSRLPLPLHPPHHPRAAQPPASRHPVADRRRPPPSRFGARENIGTRSSGNDVPEVTACRQRNTIGLVQPRPIAAHRARRRRRLSEQQSDRVIRSRGEWNGRGRPQVTSRDGCGSRG